MVSKFTGYIRALKGQPSQKLAPVTLHSFPIVSAPGEDEKQRLLDHHTLFGFCPASRYQAMPAQERPPMPEPLRLSLLARERAVKKSQPFLPRRLTFIDFMLGRMAA